MKCHFFRGNYLYFNVSFLTRFLFYPCVHNIFIIYWVHIYFHLTKINFLALDATLWHGILKFNLQLAPVLAHSTEVSFQWVWLEFLIFMKVNIIYHQRILTTWCNHISMLFSIHPMNKKKTRWSTKAVFFLLSRWSACSCISVLLQLAKWKYNHHWLFLGDGLFTLDPFTMHWTIMNIMTFL